MIPNSLLTALDSLGEMLVLLEYLSHLMMLRGISRLDTWAEEIWMRTTSSSISETWSATQTAGISAQIYHTTLRAYDQRVWKYAVNLVMFRSVNHFLTRNVMTDTHSSNYRCSISGSARMRIYLGLRHRLIMWILRT